MQKRAITSVSVDIQVLLIALWQLSLESKPAHISREPIGGFKLEENANQTFLSYSGRPQIYLHFCLRSEPTCNMPGTRPHLTFYTRQDCLQRRSLTCEAAGEHQPNSAFPPKDMLSPLWMQDLPGMQGGNTELMFGDFCSGFLLPSPIEAWWFK